MHQILRALTRLVPTRRVSGGLEITQSAVRFAIPKGDRFELVAERLPPGVIVRGSIADYAKCVDALKKVREGAKKFERRSERRKPANVILTLGSFANVYSRNFTLPAVQGVSLEEAVRLNVEMIAPSNLEELSTGWQQIGRDEASARIELLAAFVQRKLLDDITKALHEAGFFAVAAEFKALSLARLLRLRGGGVDPEKSYVLMALDSSGLDFLILRRGELQFEYFTPWKDIQGEGREIPLPAFQEAVRHSLQQVANFYSGHWTDKLSEVLVSAGEIGGEVLQVVKESFFAPGRELQLRLNQTLGWEWLVAAGSALRAGRPPEEYEFNFLGEEVKVEFHRRHVLGFLGFWRTVLPLAAILIVGAFFATETFLRTTRTSLEAQSTLGLQGGEAARVEELQRQVEIFNGSVSLAEAARESIRVKTPILRRLDALLASHGVTVHRLRIQEDAPVVLNGEANTEGRIRDFKNALTAEPCFANVVLPLQEIKALSQQKVSFAVSFSVSAEKAECNL